MPHLGTARLARARLSTGPHPVHSALGPQHLTQRSCAAHDRCSGLPLPPAAWLHGLPHTATPTAASSSMHTLPLSIGLSSTYRSSSAGRRLSDFLLATAPVASPSPTLPAQQSTHSARAPRRSMCSERGSMPRSSEDGDDCLALQLRYIASKRSHLCAEPIKRFCVASDSRMRLASSLKNGRKGG